MTRFVTITGPRATDEVPTGLIQERFEDYLGPFATSDSHFYLGGAAGIDTLALDWLAGNSSAALTVVVPCQLGDQPEVAREAVTRWRGSDRLADVIELGAPGLGSAAYHARNRWMVDRSRLVIGFPHGTDPASGTWYTLNYAAEQGKVRMVVPI